MARRSIMVKVEKYEPAPPYKGKNTVRPILACGHHTGRRFFPDNLPKRGKVGCYDCYRAKLQKEADKKAEEARQKVLQEAQRINALRAAQGLGKIPGKGLNDALAALAQKEMEQKQKEALAKLAQQKNPGSGNSQATGVLNPTKPSTDAQADDLMAQIEAQTMGIRPGKGAGQNKAQVRMAVEARKMANAEVGDFITDLMTAIKYRTEYDLSRGELLADPVRGLTDGRCFAQEYRSESNGKLRISLTLDTSGSMFYDHDGQFWTAAAVFQKMDIMLREADRSLPVGTLAYQPFVFHSNSYALPKSAVPYLCSGEWEDGRNSPYEIPPEIRRKVIDGNEGDPDIILSGGSTYIGEALRSIQKWEQNDQAFDYNATRIDIILTDGQFNQTDVEHASRVQSERQGKVVTVLLNFCEPEAIRQNLTPNQCQQYAVNKDNLTGKVRQILQEAIENL